MADAVFEHSRPVAIYDALDPDRGDLDAYVDITDATRRRCRRCRSTSPP
jgi:hypothetical protein